MIGYDSSTKFPQSSFFLGRSNGRLAKREIRSGGWSSSYKVRSGDSVCNFQHLIDTENNLRFLRALPLFMA